MKVISYRLYMKVLFVTTFNQRLYDQSGQDLLKSFLEYMKDYDLLICYEDQLEATLKGIIHECRSGQSGQSSQVYLYPLQTDEYLQKWTSNNLDRIPEIYGGTANDQIFKDKTQPWANYRCAGYFRKIVALNHALNYYSMNYDLLCIIDCDCIIKQSIPFELFERLNDNKVSMFYYWGKYRQSINRGPETGFTGYFKEGNGYDFARIICDTFSNQSFLNYEYWDDGYVIGQLIRTYTDRFQFLDLVNTVKSRTTRVMELNNPFLQYIYHFKNKHKY